MDDLTRLRAPERVFERREQRTVVFHPVPRNVNDDDPESKVLEIVLVFKPLSVVIRTSHRPWAWATSLASGSVRHLASATVSTS